MDGKENKLKVDFFSRLTLKSVTHWKAIFYGFEL